MRIRKTGAVTPTKANIVDSYNTSTTDGYSANYINGLNTYSTTEQRIGTYLGKPLYRKVIYYTHTSTIGDTNNTVNINIPHNISNFEECVFVDIIKRPYKFPRFNWDTTNNRLQGVCISSVDGADIILRIINDTWQASTWTFILEYTKTTDA